MFEHHSDSADDNGADDEHHHHDDDHDHVGSGTVDDPRAVRASDDGPGPFGLLRI